MRIDKLLEEEFCSKTKVKRLLLSKKVVVDGQVIVQGSQNVDAWFQTIFVGNQRIKRKTHHYFMLNKPMGVVTAVKDTHCQTVLDLLHPSDLSKGLHPVGRLDRDTEGLLLLTDNGQLSYQLLLPRKKVVKRYQVIVNGLLTDNDRQIFQQGVCFNDGTICQPAKLSILTATSLKSEAYLDITEGKFHQVKKMFLSTGKKVVYLKRLSMGSLQLDSKLAIGSYRELTELEMQQLLPYFVAHKKE